jgi:hypothetical protein
MDGWMDGRIYLCAVAVLGISSLSPLWMDAFCPINKLSVCLLTLPGNDTCVLVSIFPIRLPAEPLA